MQKGNVSGFENCCDGDMINCIGTFEILRGSSNVSGV